MFKLIEFTIANKYLKSKRKESFITFISWFSLIGIALGVAVLIIVMSVMNGFRKQIISNLIGLSGHVYVSSAYNNNSINNYNNVITTIKQNNLVTNAFAVINQQVLFSSNGNSFGGMVSGLSVNNILSKPLLASSLTTQNIQTFKENKNSIILGYALANSLGVKINDNVTLISPNGYSSVFGSVPKFGSYKVVALVNTGLYQYDSSLAILRLDVAQQFFNYNNSAQQIEIFLTDYNLANQAKAQLQQSLSNFYITNWQDTNKYLIDALLVERNVMFLILSLVILIASFNIVSGLTMLVKNKTKEIAILRTMGLSENSVIKIFLLVGLRIGVVGTTFGSILGCIIALNLESIKLFLESTFGVSLFPQQVYFLSQLPSDLQSFQVVFIVLLAISFSLLSAIYPAIKASKVSPAEGLKHD